MDVKIKCQECGEEFIFSERDQKFYEEKGFEPPKRCKTCRNARKDRFNQNSIKHTNYRVK